MEREHPIEQIMGTAIAKIKNLVDVDTVVGSPFVTEDGTTIIPLTKVTMGFLAGGGEYNESSKYSDYPLAGGSGVGVSMSPVGFLVKNGNCVQMVTAENEKPFDALLSMIPKIIKDWKN